MERKFISQKEVVLIYLKDNGSITAIEAINRLGITRLADVIYKLKKDGVKIETDKKSVETRYGKTEIAVYRMGHES